MIFDVERALAEIDEIAGSKVIIEDLFLHDGKTGYLKGEADPVIEITHPDLLDTLFGIVPAYAGGPYLYHHKSYIEGRIDNGENGAPVLHDIEVMKLFYKDIIFDVIGGAG